MSLLKLEMARKFRREMTASERLLWAALRRNALGLHFRRQQIIGGFIVDFYCAKARLAVEVDGSVHARRTGDDRARDHALQMRGVRTVHVTARAVDEDLDAVLRCIATAARPQT